MTPFFRSRRKARKIPAKWSGKFQIQRGVTERGVFAFVKVARLQSEFWHEIFFLRGTNFLTKNAPKFPPKFLSLCFVGPKKIPQNSRQISHQISLPKIKKKITDELLQERRENICLPVHCLSAPPDRQPYCHTNAAFPLLVRARPNCARQSLASTVSVLAVWRDIVPSSRSPRKCRYPLSAYPLFKPAHRLDIFGSATEGFFFYKKASLKRPSPRAPCKKVDHQVQTFQEPPRCQNQSAQKSATQNEPNLVALALAEETFLLLAASARVGEGALLPPPPPPITNSRASGIPY